MINASKLIILFALFFLSLFNCSISQTIETISLSNSSDSSYYTICKVSENEFWIAGEHGILKTMDSSKNLNPIVYNNTGKSIYILLKIDQTIYAIADSGTIFKFSCTNHKLIKVFTYSKYKNYSFYDIIKNEKGRLILCGGKSKILKSKKVIPSGFIIELDTSLTSEAKILWKSKLHFVWDLAQNNEDIYASVFNGLTSKILVSRRDSIHFNKKYKFRALIQKIYIQADTLWLCGSKNAQINKNGIIIKAFDNKMETETMLNFGCVWTMQITTKPQLAFTNNGTILNNKNNEWQTLIYNKSRRIYTICPINTHYLILAGTGKTILLLNIKGLR